MGNIALTWVQSHGDDPRAPEVLALILRAGHYDSSEEGAPVLRKAFLLLKTRYAATAWARDTKYWYR